jgi:cell division protein FtsN
LKTNLLKEVNFSYSSFNPFESKIPAAYHVAPQANGITVEFEKEYLFAASEAAAVEAEPANSETVVEEVGNTTATGRFQIIAGCFLSEENAHRFAEGLKGKGFDANVTGKTKTGLFKVSYNTFHTRNEAVNFLTNLQKSDPQAWLLSE